MQKSNTILSMVAVLLLGIILPLHSTTYYVAYNGDDANDGLTEGTAWNTISKALTIAVSGDVVRLIDDDDINTADFEEAIVINQGITLTRNDDVGPNPQLRDPYYMGVVIRINTDNVTVCGLDIIGGAGPGIRMYGGGNLIENNQISGVNYAPSIYTVSSSNKCDC